ncbi:MAG: hypothetical protein HY286_11000 [Planctomycetes bacterium]|nr:hypothetical protein [Planctomycetota bacterium]
MEISTIDPRLTRDFLDAVARSFILVIVVLPGGSSTLKKAATAARSGLGLLFADFGGHNGTRAPVFLENNFFC